MRVSALLCLPVLLAACPVESQLCTLIGCLSTLELTLDLPGWEDGDTVLTVDVERAVVRCTVSATGEATCDDDGLSVSFDGEGDRRVLELQGHLVEAAITVRAERDGVGVLDTTTTPDWTVSQPNGPDCSPTCVSAALTLGI
ncbi:MAG: hypothetical protein H6732_02285 [Alphaproteobacteria bacterium]|nr:hypothetical protein [Alphaproteobacteria bacterium]